MRFLWLVLGSLVRMLSVVFFAFLGYGLVLNGYVVAGFSLLAAATVAWVFSIRYECGLCDMCDFWDAENLGTAEDPKNGSV
ncbi:MAG: hypothetical protein KatS3mg109_0053 [Pirellulaceae bacterium]|nr:MAG: hypothetical protein KatS3mg109_0053 [Pirellulaceae bacterium]